MIPAFKGVSQDRFLKSAQFAALLLSSMLVFAFLRFHLSTSARAYREDFERQSFIELGRGETYLISRKLAAVSGASQFSCIVAKKAGLIFFEEKNGPCSGGLFTVRETILEANHGIELTFWFRLPSELLGGLFAFLLAQALFAALLILFQRRQLRLAFEHDLEIATLSRQVAHDVRSPLAILRTIKFGSEHLSRDQWRLYGRAVKRLEQLVGVLSGENETDERVSLGQLLVSSCEEKTVEHGVLAPTIRLEWGAPVSVLFLPGLTFEWKRVISNLLNNSIEASYPKQAEVSIRIEAVGGLSTISISDKGRGMSAASISKVGLRGFTEGKKDGKGLGLFHAKEFLVGLGGELSISSRLGEGTSVKITCPANALHSVVLVDDDIDLAMAWGAAARSRGIELQYFSTMVEFLSVKNSLPKETPIYLDLEMPEGRAALDVGPVLHSEGFTQLFICTGRSKGEFQIPGWVRGVVGKEPPWL